MGLVAHRRAVWVTAALLILAPLSHGLTGQHLNLLSSRLSPHRRHKHLGNLPPGDPPPHREVMLSSRGNHPALLPFLPSPAKQTRNRFTTCMDIDLEGLASVGSAPLTTPSPHLCASLGSTLHSLHIQGASPSTLCPQRQGSLLAGLTDASPAASPALAGVCSMRLLNRQDSHYPLMLLQGCPSRLCPQQTSSLSPDSY